MCLSAQPLGNLNPMRLICARLCLQVPQSLVFWGYHMVNAPTTWFGHSQAGRSQPPETAPAPVVFAPAQCPFVCKEPGKPNGLIPPRQMPDELLRLLFSLFLALPSSRPPLLLCKPISSQELPHMRTSPLLPEMSPACSAMKTVLGCADWLIYSGIFQADVSRGLSSSLACMASPCRHHAGLEELSNVHVGPGTVT